MPNRISQIKNVPIDGPKRPTSAMMVALEIDDPTNTPAFIDEVAEQFKVQRMMAPPETSMLLFTLLGPLTTSQFAARWAEIEAQDSVIQAFMSLMTVADVILGTSAGQVLERRSLLSAATS